MPRSYDDDDRRSDDRRKSGRRHEKEEEVYAKGRSGNKRNTQALVPRPSDSNSDSTEDIRRDFPPHGYAKRRSSRREYDRGGGRRHKSDGYYSSDSEDDYKRRSRGNRRRDRYSDSESDSASPPPRKGGDRRKSIVEQALAAAGLGDAASAVLGGKDPHDRNGRNGRDRSRDRRRNGNGRHSDSSRSRSRSVDTKSKMLQAGKAAAVAGATEAWRTRKEPGGVPGNLKRIATAAIGAAGIDGALDRDPDKAGSRHVIESALGGIMGNRVLHGRRESRSRSRSRSQSRGGGRRDRSQSRGGTGGIGLGGLASTAGLATLATKAYKNYREKSRSRGPSGSDSDGGSDRGRREGKGGFANQMRARSKSLSRMVNAGLAKFNLDDPRKTREMNGEARPRGGGFGGGSSSSSSSSDTDSYNSDKEKKKHRKMRTKELMTAGLATVATIHAGHQIYSSIEQRKARRKAVVSGQMTEAESKKLKNRANVKQAASVGIAALGIKGMISEWKEMKEQRHEYHEHERRFAEKREHRRLKMMQQGQNSSEPNLGSRYLDGGNPYATTTVPPPPMGAPRR